MSTKSYKEHLRENVKNWEDAFGYIRECVKDGDPDVLQIAVRDVWEFAAHHQRELDAKTAERHSNGLIAGAIRKTALFGSERNQT